jgi:hypothetical protein
MTALTPAKAGVVSDTKAPEAPSNGFPHNGTPLNGAPSGKPLLTADGRQP